MKKNLSRKIPSQQRNEIRLIAKELSKFNEVEKIILFWSFARWDFILRDLTEENWTTRTYESDYDIIIIQKFYKKDFSLKISSFIRNLRQKNNIERSINVITEWITHINKMLKEKRYFYTDIIKEWVLLFDTWNTKLSKAKNMAREERLKIQKEDFENWFEWWNDYIEQFIFALKRWKLNIAVFELHQAVEKYITSLLLVKTWYRPKTHDLEDFIEFLLNIDETFKNWFDFSNQEEKRKFELLRKAYVDARYSYEYQITEEELNFLAEKVLSLKEKIEKLCRQEIEKTSR